jgi:type I restriction enzyme S subunit
MMERYEKYKDSGVEWIGEIPEEWEIRRLKYLGRIKYGLGQPPKEKLDGLPLIRATNIFRGRIDEKDMVFRTNDSLNPLFISYCLLSNYVQKYQLLLHSLRAAQPHLNREELADTLIFLPESEDS